ncbi:MAG: Spy/CpxP family protein refolding chaperone [Syntrophobacteraceae bacterium]|nr:Spy/CpxP family protein refolding chaperone [Syntrophobacteraceae bacterium]
MKRIACQFTYSTTLAVAVVLFASMVLASPSPLRAASPTSSMEKARKASTPGAVEARIKELHAKLKITPAQKESWNTVAEVMRSNAKTMEALIKARTEEANKSTAVEDLKSYGRIVDAHAEAIRKFIPAFENLYAGMSDAQKKVADRLFHQQSMKSKAKRK